MHGEDLVVLLRIEHLEMRRRQLRADEQRLQPADQEVGEGAEHVHQADLLMIGRRQPRSDATLGPGGPGDASRCYDTAGCHMYSFRAKDRRRRLLQTLEVRHEFIKLIVGNRRKRWHIVAGFEFLCVVYPRPQIFWRVREDAARRSGYDCRSGSGWVRSGSRSPVAH